jgi:hypothetical protein
VSRLGAADIARMLAGRIDALAPQLLPRAKRCGPYLRVGSIAGEEGQSLAVHLAGPKRGRWYDYAAAQGGDALDLVAQTMCGGDIAKALEWARQWLGLDGADAAAVARAKASAQRSAAMQARRAQDAESRNRNEALALWLAARPVMPGDPVWRYLEGRAIALERVPRAVRCHPRLYHYPSDRHWPAMVAAIADPAGNHVATHRTWLSSDGDRAAKAPLGKEAKMTLGAYRGGVVRLTRGVSKKPWRDMPQGERLAIAEGIEDALSFAALRPDIRTAAAVALGNMLALELPAAVTTVLLIAQNDPLASKAALVLQRAAARFRAQGRRVQLVRPPVHVKDINELLQREAA